MNIYNIAEINSLNTFMQIEESNQELIENALRYEYAYKNDLSIREGVLSTIKDIIVGIIKKIIDLFRSFIHLFTENSKKAVKKSSVDVKKLLSKYKESDMDGVSLTIKNLDITQLDVDTKSIFDKIDDIINELSVSMNSINSRKFREGNESDIDDMYIKNETDKIDNICKNTSDSLDAISSNIITGEDVECTFSTVKTLYTDQMEIKKQSKTDIDKMNSLIKELKSLQSSAEKLPTDVSPNSVKLINAKLQKMYSGMQIILSKYTGLMSKIDNYYQNIYDKMADLCEEKARSN